MFQSLKQFKTKHPFTSLMLVAIAVRLLAVFLVPSCWSNYDVQQPSLIQGLLDWFKENIPMSTSLGLFVSRACYATVSIFTVSMVYRICDLLANDKAKAWNIALIPTICVIMPSFGIIDNANFFLGLPLLLYGSNVVLRQQVLLGASMKEKVHRTSYLIAGFVLGLSVCVWYASAFVVIAILLMLCVKRDFKGALMTLIGFVVTLLLVWGLLLVLKVDLCKLIA